MPLRPLIRRRSAAFGLSLLFAVGAALAGNPPLPAADADAWLERIREAGRCSSYNGTLVYSDGSSVSSTRVVHFCEGADQYEVTEALDGKANVTLRHNGLVHTLWPGTHTVVIEQRGPLGAFPALLQPGGFHVEEIYELRVLGEDRVAGHDAHVLLLRPHDQARFAQRLWAERQSGLLLRAEMLAPDGSVMERISFSEIAIGGKAKPESVQRKMRAIEGMKIVRPVWRATSLDAEGWALDPPVPGFRLVGSIRRQIELQPASAPAASPSTVLQAIYSDGLTHLSVFVAPTGTQRKDALSTRIGATYTTMRQLGDHWVTVMGDVPLDTLSKFAAALRRKP